MTFIAASMLLATGAAADTPSPLTFAQLMDFCGSDTLAGAEAKADSLGWRRVAPAELEDWRTGFIAHNGGTVEVSGWRRGEQEGDSLSFWVARGQDQHHACSYAVNAPARLLDELSARFGPPRNLDKQSFGKQTLGKQSLALTASWKLGAMEISYSQVGQSAVLYVVHSD